jgi:hypothetical protein
MRRFKLRDIISPVLLFLFFTQAGFSQGFESPELNGFKKEANYPVYTPDDLWDYINGGADSYNSLGFVDLNIVEYTKGKKNVVKLEVYRHQSNDLAFGIYALERAPSYNFIDLGVQGYNGAGFSNFYKGDFYVKIYTHSKSRKALEAVDLLANAVEEAIQADTEFPELIKAFPLEGKVINEEMFVSENVIGHSFLSDAFRASYKSDGKSFIIYLFARDNSSEIGTMVQNYLARQNLDTDNQPEGKSTFKDGYNGDIFLAWKSDRMIIITGLDAADSDFAGNYISKILK